MIKLIGKKLILRDLELSDLEAFGYWMQPGNEWQKMDGPYYPRPSKKEITEILGKWEQSINAQNWPDLRQRLVVVVDLRNRNYDEGRLLIRNELTTLSPPADPQGYQLLPDSFPGIPSRSTTFTQALDQSIYLA